MSQDTSDRPRNPSDLSRRRVVQAGLGAAGLAALPLSSAIAQSGEIVVGAAPPITGVFAFAGVGLHQGLGDYCEWRNANGGVAGRKLRYVAEDSGYKMDQAMAVFKKITAAHAPPVFYGDSTAWAKASADAGGTRPSRGRISGIPPTRVATSGLPAATASRMT